jgi:hypothetical protein
MSSGPGEGRGQLHGLRDGGRFVIWHSETPASLSGPPPCHTSLTQFSLCLQLSTWLPLSISTEAISDLSNHVRPHHHHHQEPQALCTAIHISAFCAQDNSNFPFPQCCTLASSAGLHQGSGLKDSDLTLHLLWASPQPWMHC